MHNPLIILFPCYAPYPYLLMQNKHHILFPIYILYEIIILKCYEVEHLLFNSIIAPFQTLRAYLCCGAYIKCVLHLIPSLNLA